MMWACFIVLWWFVLIKMPASRLSLMTRVIVVLLMITVAMITVRQYVHTWYPQKYVRRNVIVRVGSDESYGSCGTIARDEPVVVYQELNGWSKIRYMQLMGWLKTEELIASRERHV